MVRVVCLFQNHVDESIEMYQEMHMWEEAIEVAEAKVGVMCLLASLYVFFSPPNLCFAFMVLLNACNDYVK